MSPRLTVRDAVERASSYGHAVVSFVGHDGYPFSVAGPFTADTATATVSVGPIESGSLPADGAEVGLAAGAC